MNDKELKLECLKLAVLLVSPTVNDRKKDVVETARLLYDEISAETPTLPKKPGRPRTK
jgi:hypothetical protein